MIKATYQQLVERIARLSGKPAEEIKRLVEAKRARLSGLISQEGAAQVIAAELGISFEKQRFKIVDLLIGMKKVQVLGKVLEIYPIRRYTRAGHEGELATLMLADDTSGIRVVFWDTKHIDMIKSGQIKQGSVIEIKGADVRGTIARELHLGSGSSIELSSQEFKAVVAEEALPRKQLSELKTGERAAIRAFVVQAFQPKFFSTCPECFAKISYENDKALCPKHGTIVPRSRALLSFVVDDGSDNMRALAFNETIAALLKIKEEELEQLQESGFWLSKRQELLGTELLFSGRARRNVAFDRAEFVIDKASSVEPDQLIKELQEQ